jgi:hypothetical protein
MGQAATAEQSSCEQLVVASEQRGRVVQHHDSAGGQRPERPEAVVHPVEGGENVETADGRVARP